MAAAANAIASTAATVAARPQTCDQLLHRPSVKPLSLSHFRPRRRAFSLAVACSSQTIDDREEPFMPQPPSNDARFAPPPEWEGWQERRKEEKILASQGISIRRRPPTGPPQHYVGPFEFRIQNEGNTPRNKLEEIIWNKDVELAQVVQIFSVSDGRDPLYRRA